MQDVQLAITPEKWRLQATWLGPFPHWADKSARRHGCACAFDVKPDRRFESEGAGGCLGCAIGHQDAAGFRCLLETGGDVNGGTGQEAFVGPAGGRSQDRACVYTCSGREPDAMRPLELPDE